MIRQFIRNKTVIAIISIITGIYLMIARKNATYTLIRMVGYALFVAAAAYVVLYFVRGDHDQMKLQYAGGAAGRSVARPCHSASASRAAGSRDYSGRGQQFTGCSQPESSEIRLGWSDPDNCAWRGNPVPSRQHHQYSRFSGWRRLSA